MTGGIDKAQVDWVANAPRSIFFDDIYFSGDGAAEARHVFIDGNDLVRRFAAAQRFTIGELGFGTGLNILVAWDLWRRTEKPDGARLEFLSFEKFPLTRDDLARAHHSWPSLSGLGAALVQCYPPAVSGGHRLRLDADVALTLVFGDAPEMLARMDAGVDAWFLDGFAPSKNPEMWSPEVFAEIARLSASGATAATFTVAGAVRRALSAAGFQIEKRAGHGRKREMLAARLKEAVSTSRRAPWFANENLTPLSPGASVAIIGGGVAGASLAHELLGVGLAPVIIDPDGIAAGASGNPAGLIMPRVDAGDDAAARFSRAAYFHALRTIEALEDQYGERIFNPCGVLLHARSPGERARQDKILAAKFFPENWIEARADGLFFPQAGVIDPVRYCELLSAGAPLIKSKALSVSAAPEGVLIRLQDREEMRADAVVLANGADTLRFAAARTLPLSRVMGQIDFFPEAAAPAVAHVFGPYAAPAPAGGLVIGATYEPVADRIDPYTTKAASAENIGAVRAALRDFAALLSPDAAHPRASIRCQTPDRLPVAGPQPDWNFYGDAYDDLRHGIKRDYRRGRIVPGVHILTGLGSRGLVTAPLAAAAMVAEMTGAPSPLEREIAEALHPARFFIRDLRRAKRILSK